MPDEVLGSSTATRPSPSTGSDGEAELFWVLDDLHCPNPRLAAVLRHRRLVADVRPHVPPLRHAVRVRLDREGGQRLRLHRRHPGRPGGEGRGRRVRQPLRAARARWTRPTPAGSAPTCSRCCRTTRRTSWTGGATGCCPRSSATSPTSTATTSSRPGLVELAVLLEDAIDVHDRHWKIHWMLNFAQFSATLALNATIADVRGEVDPALPGRLQSSRRRPQLGLHRGALAAQGAGQGRRRAARGVRRRHGRRRAAAPGGHARPAGASWAEGIEPYASEFGRKADLVARVRLPDVVRAAGADPRGAARLPARRTTTTPRRSSARDATTWPRRSAS